MTNIKSLGDYIDNNEQSPYSYAGGHNSAIGIDNGHGHVVQLYADGFIVDNGPFRPLSDPINERFVSDIKNGLAPREFQDGNNPVNVHLVDYTNKRYKNENNNNTNNNNKEKDNKDNNNNKTECNFNNKNCGVVHTDSEWCLGENNTTLRIKLYTGDMINLTISQEATIADLKQFISKHSTNGLGVNLLFGFPPKIINFEDSTTLKEADILNCNIIQK